MKYQSVTRQRIDDLLQNLGKSSSLVDDADLATLMQLISVHIHERTADLAQNINILEDRLKKSGIKGSLLVKDVFMDMFQSHPISHEISVDTDNTPIESQTTTDQSFIPDEEEMKLEEKQALEDGLAALHLFHDTASPMMVRSPSGNLSIGESTHSVPPTDIFNLRDLPPIIGSQDFFEYIAHEDLNDISTHHS